MSIVMVPSSVSLTASVPAASTIILSSSDKESALLMTAWNWCTASWGRVPKIDGTWPFLDLVDRFRCFVGIFFEGMNLVTGDIKKVLERVASIRAKMPLTRLLSHVSVMAISSSWGEILL